MNAPHVIPSNRMLKTADWLFDKELEERDNAAIAEYDRRGAIEKDVTFADLLEEMAGFTASRQEVFMQAYRGGASDDEHTIRLLIHQAMESIVVRRLNGEV